MTDVAGAWGSWKLSSPVWHVVSAWIVCCSRPWGGWINGRLTFLRTNTILCARLVMDSTGRAGTVCRPKLRGGGGLGWEGQVLASTAWHGIDGRKGGDCIKGWKPQHDDLGCKRRFSGWLAGPSYRQHQVGGGSILGVWS
jgi:hypothetical protein